ncbi:uncharacterized protein LOC134814199 isoform X2 [Bolinopsis microptera]|uniref:uncharacterized protein LOC134814199 isoform X2 n=1 Tax=Bolinopsis microptera TaxID=2820187 RepID=UPI003079420C
MSFDRKMLQIYVSFFALLPCTIAQNEDIDGTHISVEPPMNKWPIIWHQAVTISCAWTPLDKLRRKGKAEGDIFVQQLNNDREVSIFADPIYGDMINLEDPKERVYFESNNEAGTSFLVIKNVTKEDSRRFKCRVNGGKISDGITLEILEPPVKEVSNFVASPGYDKAELSWDAVVGAITYIVKYQLLDAQQWEMVEVENPNVTIEYLDPATEYKALVSASNTAGIRANVLPAEIVFKTGGFKAPCLAGNFMTKTGCKQCGENSYSSDGASSCISCPDGQVSDAGSKTVADCYHARCSAGDFMTKTGCKQCGENSYSSDGAFSCISCPDGTAAPTGSTSVEDCQYAPCSAGDFMTKTGCKQCGENSYSSNGASSCISCPDGQVSDAGSKTVADCYHARCSAGDFMTKTGCKQCGENSYSSDGASSCISCPDGTAAPTGSTSVEDCQYVPCSAGDFMTKTGCKQCGENSYSSNGASSCISCPPAHVSAKGSSSFDDCKPITCLAGNYMTDSGCKQCGENTYSADGASSCISCPNGKFSAEGSTSNNDCESRDTDKPDISIQPSVENGPIIWHQTVVISCSWPLHALHEDREPEIFVQRRDNFIYIESDIILNKTISLKDPEQRVYYEVNKEEGTLVLVIKNVTKEDSGTFMCWMYRGKRSDLVKVDILEPPMSVTNLVATPAEDTVKLTWDAVGRDTTYTVQYKPNDAEEWTEVHSVLSHLKIEHLIPATEYIARVSAANSAGIRDGLVPVEITFFSKGQMEYFNFERYLELTTVDIYKQLRAANEKKKAERYKHDGFNKNENVLVEVIEDKVKRSVGDLIEKRADNCRVFNKKGWSICKN